MQPGDIVYHLGDVAFYRKQVQVEALLSRLHGQKFLIRGNHDHKAVRKAKGWAQVVDYKEVTVEIDGLKQHIVLFHYPMRTWNGAHHGTWALHGHCHGTLQENLGARTFDVGVDCWNYAPISLGEVAAKMENHTYEVVDHHGKPFPAGVHHE